MSAPLNVDKLTINDWKAIVYLLSYATDEHTDAVATIYDFDLEKTIEDIREDIRREDR